jgi:hypothetical protein
MIQPLILGAHLSRGELTHQGQGVGMMSSVHRRVKKGARGYADGMKGNRLLLPFI